jgi:hypothetical protein
VGKGMTGGNDKQTPSLVCLWMLPSGLRHF